MKRCKNCRAKTTPTYGRCTQCGYLIEPIRTEDYIEESNAVPSGGSAQKVIWKLNAIPKWLIAIAFLVSLIPILPATLVFMIFLHYLDRWGISDALWGMFLIEILSFVIVLSIYGALFKLWCEIILPTIRSKFGG